MNPIKRIKVWWYTNEIDAVTAEYFDLKDMDDVAVFRVMLGEMSKESYDRVGNRVKYLKRKRTELIIKLMELEKGVLK